MNKIVVDTSILIDYVNGYAPWLDKILIPRLKIANVILPTIVIAEYFTSTALEEEKEVKIAKQTFSLFQIQDLTQDIAQTLGVILRHKNYPSGTSLADLIVAATAISLDASLATRDKRDFDNILNLRIFAPPA